MKLLKHLLKVLIRTFIIRKLLGSFISILYVVENSKCFKIMIYFNDFIITYYIILIKMKLFASINLKIV